MATVTYNCTGCVVIDRAVIDAYNILTSTEKYVSSAESDRATAEEARVLAEQGRVQQASDDHGIAQEDHRIAVADHDTADGDHTTATGDHRTASDDHTTAVADHGTAGDDHTASTAATNRANDAAAAAEHMVDIHQGPQGPEGKPAVLGNNGNWWTWDEDTEQYVDTGQQAQGPTGATPNFSIGTVTTGAAGSQAAATITGTTDNPALNLTIPKGDKGDQGNTGSSVDYPFELVNNTTTDDATKASTAAVAKGLKDDITQLEAKVYDDMEALLPATVQDGFFITDELLNVVMKYTADGFDAAKVSAHFVQALLEAGFFGDSFVNTNEDGFAVVDENLNIGFIVDNDGARAKNIYKAEVINE